MQEGRWNKVRALQHLLTNSLYAKALAVKRVTSNKGKKTPGVDGVLWRSARAKGEAMFSLRRRGYIKDGFTFLGQTFRKHGRVLHITPAKEGVLALIRKAGELIRTHVSAPMPYLIKKLNETLRGWGNYHRHVVASEAFSRIDTYVYEELWRMLRRRHSKKSRKWLARKYWLTPERKWVFTATGITKKGKRLYQVVRLGAIGIRRHIKVKADANPYLREYAFYFWRRRQDKESRLLPAMSAREYRAMTA